uniref:Guanylate cyclase activator 1g n=1 Tax=Oryzias sinensis TaxID=183150 RepID=A0A8C7X4X0_9TELE
MAQQKDGLITEMDSAQIQELCIIFLKQCPSGALHLHEFKRIFGVQSGSSEESIFLETIFRSFDTNQDNTLDFLEYVSALNLILRGNLEDRLKWSFKLYDKDGNGKLDRQEVTRIIRVRVAGSSTLFFELWLALQITGTKQRPRSSANLSNCNSLSCFRNSDPLKDACGAPVMRDKGQRSPTRNAAPLYNAGKISDDPEHL